MLTIGAKVVMGDLLKALEGAQSQIPFATAKGLTDTIKDVREAEKQEMRKVFQGPTRYTLDSLYIKPATKSRPYASTWLKDGDRQEHYLLPQIKGGNRPLKRFEQRLVMNGLMKATQRAVPAAGAKLDAYGNMSRAQIVQILSQLRTAVVQGDFSNASNSKRSRSKRQSATYFVSTGKGSNRHGFKGELVKGLLFAQHLHPGVWIRYQFAWGTAVRPVLLFVDGSKYGSRFDFFGVAERTIDARLPINMGNAVALALRTARLSVQGGLF